MMLRYLCAFGYVYFLQQNSKQRCISKTIGLKSIESHISRLRL